jgi:teichuronic acid exporter
MKLGESIRKSTSWVLAGKASNGLFGFAIGVILARLLVPADFGMIVTIQIFTGMAGFVATGGMGEALVQARHVEDRDYYVVFTIQALICMAIYGFFFVIAPWFALWFDNPLYTDLLRISALNFLLRPFDTNPKSRLKRAMRFKAITIISIVGTILSGAVSILMALQDMGPMSLIMGGLTGSVSSIIMLYAITRKRPGIHFNKAVARRLGGFGIKMSLNGIVFYLRSQTSNFIISRLSGPAMLGLYNKADSMSKLPASTISNAAYQTVFRALAKIQDNIDQSAYVYLRTVTLVTVYTLPFYVGLLWLAEPFITFVYGEKWSAAGPPLAILATTGLFRCVSNASGAVSAARNRLGYELRIQIESWGLLTVGCLIGFQWGLTGIAWGVVPSFIYTSLRMARLATDSLQMRMGSLLPALKPAFLLNIALGVTLAVTDLMLPGDLDATSPGIYLGSMTLVGGMVYGGLFLFAPIEALASESQRWRRNLRLT